MRRLHSVTETGCAGGYRLLRCVCAFTLPLALFATARAAPEATAALSARAYVQDGLIGCYDGLENRAWGLHDASATSWTDITSNQLSWTAVSGEAWCGDATYEIQGPVSGQHSAWMNGSLPVYMTLEIGLRWDEGQQVLAQRSTPSDSYQRIFILNWGDGTFGANRTFYGQDASVKTGSTNFFAAVYGGDGSAPTQYYLNGAAVSTTTTMKYGWALGDYPALGSRYNTKDCNFRGGLYAMRFYNRVLAADEVAWNNMIDRHRFFGAALDASVSTESRRVVDGEARGLAIASVSSEVVGSVTLTANGTSYAGGASAWLPCDATNALTYLAVPPAGGTFDGWFGETQGIASVQLAQTSLVLASSVPRRLTAVFNVPGVKTWVGSANVYASNPANWRDENGAQSVLAPRNGDAVVVDADGEGVSHPMTWNIDNVTLSAWTQTVSYASVVTFQTGPIHEGVVSPTHGVLSSDGKRRELVVTGDIVLHGGAWRQEDTPSLTSSHPGWKNGEGVYRVIARAGGDFTVAAGASVSATNGFRLSQGPGVNASGWGASHGGQGGPYYAGDKSYTATTYGSVRAPVTQGSSGSDGRGGGAIELSCGGAFTLDGFLDAGATKFGQHYTSAGGSVFVTAKTLAGAGAMRANAVCGTAGCGGGGRIAVVLTGTDATFDDYTGTMFCTCQKGSAQPGTIYLETPSNKADGGDLILRGNGVCSTGYRGLYTLLKDTGEDYAFARIVLTNGVNFGIAPGVTVRTKKLVTDGKTGCIDLVGGTLVVPDGVAFTNVTLLNDFKPSVITTPNGASGTNLLAKGVTFTINTNVTFGGTFRMLSGSTVNHSANGGSDAGFRANFAAENLVIDSGASVNLDGKGFSAANGPGKPIDDGKTDRSGSHGGLAHDVGSVKTYGSITRPTTLGSGGRSNQGSGATHIRVKGLSQIDGTISASRYDWYWSGAAGSVWLETGRLKGAKTGAITANGIYRGYNNSYYGGAGGRVAVTLTESDADLSEYLGVIQAKGAACWNGSVSQTFAAGDGTVYIRQRGEAENEGTLIVSGTACDNTDNYTDITDAMTECLVGHVVVTNYGRLRVRKGAELQVRKTLSNASKYAATHVNGEAGDDDTAPGAIAFVDASVESTVTGTNIFMCLKCAEPGKTVRFGSAADTFTGIDALGQLQIAGSDAAYVFLRGLADGTAWLFDFHGKTDVTRLDVRDSDARSGDLVSVDDTNIDSGNNQNWSIVSVKIGDTNRWTGATSAAWATAGNWSLARAPVDTDVIVIPETAACSPALSEGLTLNRLEIASGKSLALNGFSLTVTNGVACAGSIVCSGSEALTFSGDVTIKGFTKSDSTLTLAGATARTVDLGGQDYRRIVVGTTGSSSLSFKEAFSTDFLTCDCAAAFALSFAGSKTFTIGEMSLSGVVGSAAALTVKSMIDGTAFNLNVTGKASGTGLIVRDSRVTGSISAFAYHPSTQGDNVTGWVFGITETTWQGGASGNWSVAANWSGGAVPGADSCVHFTSDATVTLDADDATAKILDISDCTVNLKGAKTLTVKTLFEILDGGTLSQASSGNVVRVEGAAYVRSGGKWTHAENGTASAVKGSDNGYRVQAEVTGNMTVEEGGSITVYGCGYCGGCGPGTQSSASYGGRYNSSSKACYGSMFRPDSLGSGGEDGELAKKGGGRIRLVVGGTLTVDGSIAAQGATTGFYNASGGSVWITCGTLAGAGTVQANGANKSSYYNTGCGGRVAIYQTTATDFASFTGAVTTYGGVTEGIAGAYPERSAGTVYLQSAGQGDGYGVVYVKNNRGDPNSGYETGGVDLPVTNLCDDDVKSYRHTTFSISAGGVLYLTRDVEIGELELTSASRVNLNGHTLTISSWKHKNRRKWPTSWGTICGIYPGTDASGNPGKIVWKPRPLCVIVR